MTVLLKYFPRQLRDMLLTRGAAMLVVGVIFSLPVWLSRSNTADVDFSQLLGVSMMAMAPLMTLVATYGIIGEDFRRGYYRFLFAKPINPMLYYAQAFFAALLVFVIVELLIVAVFSVVVEPTWPTGAIKEGMATFVFWGSIIFALSRVTRMDWLIGMTFLVLGNGVRDWFPPHEVFRGKIFNVIMPPTHVFDPGLFPADGVDWANVAWAGGYAAVCLAIGLSLVRFIPLSNNG